ncbi:hypothetical protein EJK50_0155 [Moraxella catarrhalis]|nr:hypothetical protein EJK50_0155 [Moraxella catarrhalis]
MSQCKCIYLIKKHRPPKSPSRWVKPWDLINGILNVVAGLSLLLD